MLTGANTLKSLSDLEESSLLGSSLMLPLAELQTLLTLAMLAELKVDDPKVLVLFISCLTEEVFDFIPGLFKFRWGHFLGNFGICLQPLGSISIDLLYR